MSQHVGARRKIRALCVNLYVRSHMCFCACDIVVANVDTPSRAATFDQKQSGVGKQAVTLRLTDGAALRSRSRIIS